MFQLPVFPADKANHFVYGALIGAAAAYFGPKGALMAALVAGAFKELFDAIANYRAGSPVHGVELEDFLATTAGGATVALGVALSRGL